MKKITILHGSTIESALQYLKMQSKIQNETLCADFNDKAIFSTDSIDDAYKRIVGKTKEEFDADVNKWREEYDRKEQEHKDNIPNLTEEYRQKARGLVIESELEYWDKIVPVRLSDLYHGMELQQVIDCAIVMRNTTITKEERLRIAYKIFMDAGHSGMSASLTMAMLRRFCPNGNELADACKEFDLDNMKTLQCNFTTPELSKRLLELGVPAWTADCYYYDFFDKHPKVSYIDADREYKWNLESEYAPKPCWSVGRLIEIFCICTDDRWSIEYLNGMPQTIIEKTIEAITGNKVDFSKLEE